MGKKKQACVLAIALLTYGGLIHISGEEVC